MSNPSMWNCVAPNVLSNDNQPASIWVGCWEDIHPYTVVDIFSTRKGVNDMQSLRLTKEQTRALINNLEEALEASEEEE